MSRATKAVKSKKTKIIALVVLMFLILLSFLAIEASRGAGRGWERAVFEAIYGWPDFLLPLFLVVTQLGSAWMLIGATLFIAAARRGKLALKILLGGSLTYLFVSLIKDLIARPRPEFLLENVTSREPLISGFGFPSGHTALATALGLLILPNIPKTYRVAVILLVALVGVSRIYLGVHSPLDVLGGFMSGGIVAGIFFLAKKAGPGRPKWLYRKVLK